MTIDAFRIVDPLNDKDCRELLAELLGAMLDQDVEDVLATGLNIILKRKLIKRWEKEDEEV